MPEGLSQEVKNEIYIAKPEANFFDQFHRFFTQVTQCAERQ